MMNFKKGMALLLATFMLAVTTACGESPQPTGAPSSVPASEGAALDGSDMKIEVDKNDPFYINASQNILRVGGGYEPPETLHANVWATAVIGNVADFVHEKLFDFVPIPDHTYMPVLGESFEVGENTITIKLRKNAKWSDGTPFTSKDVVANFNMGFVGNWTVWNYLESIEAVDDHTVLLKLVNDNAITTQLCTNVVMNTPHHIYREWSDKAGEIIANRKPGTDGNRYDRATNEALATLRESLFEFKPDVMSLVGTGPFVLKDITTAEAVMVRNEMYYNPDNIKFEQLKIVRNTSIENLLNIMMSKGYDVENLGLSPDVHHQVVKDNPNMRIVYGSDLGQPAMQFNMKIAPMDDVRVRKAVHHIVDRASLLFIAEPGSESSDLTSSGMIPAMRDMFLSTEFQGTLEEYNGDHARAEALLTEAGWSRGSDNLWKDANGKVVELEFATTSTYPTFFLCADAIVNQLNEFGIKTTMKSFEASAYWKHLQEQGAMMSISMRPGSPNYGHPWEIYRSFFIDGAADMGFTTLAEKKAGLTDVVLTLEDGSKLDTIALLDELLNTKDDQRQNEIVEQFAKLVNENSYFMPLVTKYIPQKLHNPYLTGFPTDRDDPMWYGGGAGRVAARLIREGKLHYSIPQ